MIQRIQTLFLIAATALQVVFMISPLATFLMEDNVTIKLYCSGFKTFDIENVMALRNISMLILCISILALTFFDIFLYKKRILQIRICIYSILLNVGMIVLVFLTISKFMNNNPVSQHTYSVTLAIPIVSIILLFLAFRGIRKDELLIKAYDRLR
jgi:tellurite resistance protein TehA-like permease